MSLLVQIQHNLREVRAAMSRACDRAGRNVDDVTLVAVTKSAEPDWMHALYDLGVRDFGESRPQQLLERAPDFPDDVRWHLIGHLQRNKARRILPGIHLIHSVDTLRLLEALDRLCEELACPARVLLEVNVSGEAAKDGFTRSEVLSGWKRIVECRRLRIAGLMTMAPLADNREAARPVFSALRALRDELQAVSPPHVPLAELSMGMSGDFETGIEEGATLVRVGSRLFEGLAAS